MHVPDTELIKLETHVELFIFLHNKHYKNSLSLSPSLSLCLSLSLYISLSLPLPLFLSLSLTYFNFGKQNVCIWMFINNIFK